MVRLDGPREPDRRHPHRPATGADPKDSPGDPAIAGYAVRPSTCSTNTASVIQQPAQGASDCRER